MYWSGEKLMLIFKSGKVIVRLEFKYCIVVVAAQFKGHPFHNDIWMQLLDYVSNFVSYMALILMCSSFVFEVDSCTCKVPGNSSSW